MNLLRNAVDFDQMYTFIHVTKTGGKYFEPFEFLFVLNDFQKVMQAMLCHYVKIRKCTNLSRIETDMTERIK